MKVLRRLCWALALVSPSCAGRTRAPGGEMVFVVDTQAPIGRVVVHSDDGMPFMLGSIPIGTTIFRYWVRPGRYCVREVVTGTLDAGRVTTIGGSWCADVPSGSRVYMGHVRADAQGQLAFDHDEAALQQQLADPTLATVEGHAGARPPK